MTFTDIKLSMFKSVFVFILTSLFTTVQSYVVRCKQLSNLAMSVGVFIHARKSLSVMQHIFARA